MSVMGIFKKHPWCPEGMNRSKCQRNSKKEWNSILLQEFSFLQQTVVKKFSISLCISVCWGWGRIVFNFIFKRKGQPDTGKIQSFSSQDILSHTSGSFCLQPTHHLPGTLPCARINSAHHFHTSTCREASLLAMAEQGIYAWTLLNDRKEKKPHRSTNKEAARNPPLMLTYCSSPMRKARDVGQPKSPFAGVWSHLLKPWFPCRRWRWSSDQGDAKRIN